MRSASRSHPPHRGDISLNPRDISLNLTQSRRIGSRRLVVRRGLGGERSRGSSLAGGGGAHQRDCAWSWAGQGVRPRAFLGTSTSQKQGLAWILCDQLLTFKNSAYSSY